MKGTQCGLSEFLIVSTFAFALEGLSHLYVFPTEQVRNSVVADRIDRLLIENPAYRTMRSESDADNKSLKLLARGSVAFVGSNSPVSFVSYPADVLTIDELDQCDQENLTMAVERLSASKHRIVRKVSNPTFDGVGISAEYAKSDRRQWAVKCHCGHSQVLDFFKHLADERGEAYDKTRVGEDPFVVCERCHGAFDRFGQGGWSSQHAESGVVDRELPAARGYQISKLFSTQVTTSEIIERYKEGLANETILQRWYNGDLGLPYTAKGSKIGRDQLDACCSEGDDRGRNRVRALGEGESRVQEFGAGANVIGIDPGSKIHYVILRGYRVVRAGWEKTIDGIAGVMRENGVRLGVIDAAPELQMVNQLKRDFPGLYSQRYVTGAAAVNWKPQSSVDNRTRTIVMPRTLAMDRVKEMIVKRELKFPQDAASLDGGDFYAHLMAPVRTFDEDRNEYVWHEGAARDDYYHALGYAIVAANLWHQVKGRA